MRKSALGKNSISTLSVSLALHNVAGTWTNLVRRVIGPKVSEFNVCMSLLLCDSLGRVVVAID